MSCLLPVFLVVMLVIWVLYTSTKKKSDNFIVAANEDIPLVNTGPEPWERHPINSIPMDYDVRYKKMYMNEFANKEFEENLQKIFSLPNKAKTQESKDLQKWQLLATTNQLYTSIIKVAYDNFISYIFKKLNDAEELYVPYDNPYTRPKVQLVHDVLLEFWQHTAIAYKYMMHVQLITYRENKFHGKHLDILAISEYVPTSKTWKHDIVSAKVLGVVPEDNIGFFPVVGSSPLKLDNNKADFVADQVIPSNEVVINTLRKQNSLQMANVNADIALQT